jgi:hypothetical protein
MMHTSSFIILASESIQECVKSFNIKNFIFDAIPVLRWIPTYPAKKNLAGDIVSGITVKLKKGLVPSY